MSRPPSEETSPLLPVARLPVGLFPAYEGLPPAVERYIAVCRFYGVDPNVGVLMALRYRLAELRVSGYFGDKDMLALADLLCDAPAAEFAHLARLDFAGGERALRSHGAVALARVLLQGPPIQELRLSGNKLGVYGARALAPALAKAPALRVVTMRGCAIGEAGAREIAGHALDAPSRLEFLDLALNGIGWHGTEVLSQAAAANHPTLELDLSANLVFVEVMNSVTHGLGTVLCIVGTVLLLLRVAERDARHFWSCAVYGISQCLLFISSTLYHSFFTCEGPRSIFHVMDLSGIYILIAGSYTPYMVIVFPDKPQWSVYMIAFIWLCCVVGILVEATCRRSRRKDIFALALYLSMGWAAVLPLRDLVKALPWEGVFLLVLGGVTYTLGVPFYVRNRNLDHAVWHVFVLFGAVFHWFSVYSYVVPMP